MSDKVAQDSNYKKIGEDANIDTIYLIKKNNPRFDTKYVYVNKLGVCKVISHDDNFFTIQVDKPEDIVGGMSGSKVRTLYGVEIGFVSKLIGEGKILVVRTR